MRHHLHQTFVSHAVYFFRRHRIRAVTIGSPQQKQVAQTLQACGRTRLDNGIRPLRVEFYGRDHPNRITFREAPTETGRHQHIPYPNIGIGWQMFQLQIVSTAIACGNNANIVTQHLNRQCMGRITN